MANSFICLGESWRSKADVEVSISINSTYFRGGKVPNNQILSHQRENFWIKWHKCPKKYFNFNKNAPASKTSLMYFILEVVDY